MRSNLTIIIIVKEGKDRHLEAVVPLKTGLHFEFPEPIPTEFSSMELVGVDVVPHLREKRRKFGDEEDPNVPSMTWDEWKRAREGQAGPGKFDSGIPGSGGGSWAPWTSPKEVDIPKNHVHEAKNSRLAQYDGCVNEAACVPAAHDGSARTETCSCDAERKINVCSKWSEPGEWR